MFPSPNPDNFGSTPQFHPIFPMLRPLVTGSRPSAPVVKLSYQILTPQAWWGDLPNWWAKNGENLGRPGWQAQFWMILNYSTIKPFALRELTRSPKLHCTQMFHLDISQPFGEWTPKNPMLHLYKQLKNTGIYGNHTSVITEPAMLCGFMCKDTVVCTWMINGEIRVDEEETTILIYIYIIDGTGSPSSWLQCCLFVAVRSKSKCIIETISNM